MDQDKHGVSRNEQSGNRPERPLGRGLEDVSHLFLSQRTDEAAAVERRLSRSMERGHPPPGPGAGNVLLRSGPAVTRERLATMVRGFEDALEEGLRGLDADIPCHPCGAIDLLALDRANQIAVIDFDTTSNDELLLRGIGHVDWLMHNTPIVRRMYPGRAIDFSLQPRVFLLAPQFSRLFRSVARQIARPEITCVKYHVVEFSGGPGILFERVASE